MTIRLLLWRILMAWVGFFIAGNASYLPVGITGAILGAGVGLLAATFSLKLGLGLSSNNR